MSAQPLPVVFVHGLIGTLGDPDLLRRFAPRLALVPDLLGYGAHAAVSPALIDLDAQVDHLAGIVEGADARRVHLVGHSVGGVVAALFADRHPGRVASLVSVEGNFTLADAFWSAEVARMAPDEVERMLAASRADPSAWLREDGVASDGRRLALARRWLDDQPASTVQAMARAVVETTGRPDYEATLRRVFAVTHIELVAGERSRGGWDAPDWALAAAALTVIPDTGHLMMLERPQSFAETIARLLAQAEARQPPG